jgi:hypothetical protein
LTHPHQSLTTWERLAKRVSTTSSVPKVEPEKTVDDVRTSNSPAHLVKADTINLIATAPRRLFVYWSHARDPFRALEEAFGKVASKYSLAVRFVNLTNGHEEIREATAPRWQWLEAAPGVDYRADVGFAGNGLPFITVLSSAVVRTPRETISPNADASREFHVSEAQFSVLLKETGFKTVTSESNFTGSSEQTLRQHGAADSTETF